MTALGCYLAAALTNGLQAADKASKLSLRHLRTRPPPGLIPEQNRE